jgi:hypothetical protein
MLDRGVAELGVPLVVGSGDVVTRIDIQKDVGVYDRDYGVGV